MYMEMNNIMLLYMINNGFSINTRMNLLLAGRLCRPPSSVHCFRDITLYAHVFTNLHVLLTCAPHNKDRNWRWLKNHGAMDYIQDIVEHGSESGVLIGPERPCAIQLERLTENGLNRVISYLNVYNNNHR